MHYGKVLSRDISLPVRYRFFFKVFYKPCTASVAIVKKEERIYVLFILEALHFTATIL
jgi:hypothetical protein